MAHGSNDWGLSTPATIFKPQYMCLWISKLPINNKKSSVLKWPRSLETKCQGFLTPYSSYQWSTNDMRLAIRTVHDIGLALLQIRHFFSLPVEYWENLLSCPHRLFLSEKVNTIQSIQSFISLLVRHLYGVRTNISWHPLVNSLIISKSYRRACLDHDKLS